MGVDPCALGDNAVSVCIKLPCPRGQCGTVPYIGSAFRDDRVRLLAGPCLRPLRGLPFHSSYLVHELP